MLQVRYQRLCIFMAAVWLMVWGVPLAGNAADHGANFLAQVTLSYYDYANDVWVEAPTNSADEATVNHWQQFRVKFDYELPYDGVMANDTMRFDLPQGLKFSLSVGFGWDLTMDLGGGNVVRFGKAYIRLDSTTNTYYVESIFNEEVQNYNYITGDITLEAAFSNEDTGSMEYEFGDKTYFIKRPERPPFNGNEELEKWGYHIHHTVDGVEGDYFEWIIRFHQGENVGEWTNPRIVDKLGPYQKIVPDPDTGLMYRVWKASMDSNTSGLLTQGTDFFVTPTVVDGVTTGFEMTFPSPLPQGTGYNIRYYTQITQPLDQIPMDEQNGIFNGVEGYNADGLIGERLPRYRDLLGSNIDGYAQAQLKITKMDDRTPSRPITSGQATFELRRKDGGDLESSIAGVLSELTVSSDNKVATMKTNSAGIAAVKGLVYGIEYTVREIQAPDGYIRSTDVFDFIATENRTFLYSFVNRVPRVSVGDFVWLDSNKNGIQDAGEPGIQGVTLTLTDKLGHSVIDVDGHPVGPATTDASGYYVFKNLPVTSQSGGYTVTVTPPAGYVATTSQAPGSTVDNDSSPGSETSVPLLEDGAEDMSLDFGFHLPMHSTAAPSRTIPPAPSYPTLRVPLSVKKVLKNGSLAAGAYTFQLKDASGKVLAEIANAADGTVSFPDRTFSREVSNYLYTIEEVPGTDAKVTYDKTVYTVKVTTRAVSGRLEATVQVEKDGTPFAGQMVFTNVRKAPPTGDSGLRLPLLLTLMALGLGGASLVVRKKRRMN